MKEKSIKILAIESSCDETAAAVIGFDPHLLPLGKRECRRGGPIILSSIVSSQVDLHAKTGGVVPEVASRAHVESIIPVISEALLSVQYKKSNIKNKNDNEKLINKLLNEKSLNDQYSEAIGVLQNDIDFIAVTTGPGLIGSLLVGYNVAKTLAYALGKPIIPINHIEGHIYSAFSRVQEWTTKKTNHENIKSAKLDNLMNFPLLALTVSGGHTSLTLMTDHGKYRNIGSTLDDAAGEAFDKVAKLLELGYPGGPAVSKLAAQFRAASQKLQVKSSKSKKLDELDNLMNLKTKLVFPRPIMNDGTFNFSFSGLKTAVLQKVLDIKKENYYSNLELSSSGLTRGSKALDSGYQDAVRNDIMKCELSIEQKQEVCAAFEDAVVDVLVTKTIRAAEKYRPKNIILAGGVAANKHLREVLEYQVSSIKYQGGIKPQFLVPPMNLCGDNAAMIGLAAYYHVERGRFSLKRNVPNSCISTWNKIKVDSNLEL